jgi:hypothetical protein
MNLKTAFNTEDTVKNREGTEGCPMHLPSMVR